MADRISISDLDYGYRAFATSADAAGNKDGATTPDELRAYANSLRAKAATTTDEKAREALEAQIVSVNTATKTVGDMLATLRFSDPDVIAHAIAVARELAQSKAVLEYRDNDYYDAQYNQLLATIQARGIPPAQAKDVATLAFAFSRGRGKETPDPIMRSVDIDALAADGEISADDIKAINASIDKATSQSTYYSNEVGAQPAVAKALALADAERAAKHHRDLARAAQALNITLTAKAPEDEIRTAVRKETKAITPWTISNESQASAIADKVIPMLTSSDANVRARANLMVQDLAGTHWDYYWRERGWDGWGLFEGSSHHESGTAGALANDSVRLALASKIVERLTPEQLRSLEPGSAAMLMVDLYSGNNTHVSTLGGAEVNDGRSNEWSFVSSGNFDTIKDGRVWRSTTKAPTDAAALAAIAKLEANPPRNLAFGFKDDTLDRITYRPRL